MNLVVQIKQVYGNRTIYPVCDVALKFAALLGTKTFTGHAIKHLKDLGYTLTVLGETL